MSDPNNEIANTGGPASSAEPSMEEILASIRRILNDDQPDAGLTARQQDDEEDILVLDASMMVKPAPAELPEEPPWVTEPIIAESETYPDLQPHLSSELSGPGEPAGEMLDLPPAESLEFEMENYETDAAAPESGEKITMSDEAQHNVQPPHGLVSDAASDAAAGSIGALIRSISADRSVAVGRPGLTLEDLVREELRPLLKAWLDSNLPALVERIVRAEIQRVVERSAL